MPLHRQECLCHTVLAPIAYLLPQATPARDTPKGNMMELSFMPFAHTLALKRYTKKHVPAFVLLAA
jgi:hypothetical protein